MNIVIVGAGEVGSHLAKMLSREGSDVCVIDTDSERISKLNSSADVVTVQGSPTSLETLRDANADKADLFVAVYPFSTQEMNIVSALLAKNLGAKKVIARINDEDYLTAENKLLFKEMGIELMFYPERIAADEIVEQLRHSSTAENMDFARGKLQVALFKVDEDSPLLEMKLGEFAASVASENLQFRVIAISRGETTIIPKFDTQFQYQDLVFTIAKREGMPTLIKLFGKRNEMAHKVMIFGGGEIAEMVARSLIRSIDDIKIIEKDKEVCLQLAEKLGNNVQIANGDARDTDFLLEESIKDYDAFVAVSPSDETNVLACVVAKKLGIERTVAEVENIEYIHLAEDMGIDVVINKKLITAGRIFKFTLSGKARFVKYMRGTSAEVLEYTVAPGSEITKRPLCEMKFPAGAIVGGAIRGSESFIAVGDTQIEAYDRVVVFALPEYVQEVDTFFK